MGSPSPRRGAARTRQIQPSLQATRKEGRPVVARPPTGSVVENRTRHGVVLALRFRDQHGQRQYETLGARNDGWTRQKALDELDIRLAQVKLGVYQPRQRRTVVEPPTETPTFHELSSRWVHARQHEVDERTVEHWKWALSSGSRLRERSRANRIEPRTGTQPAPQGRQANTHLDGTGRGRRAARHGW